MDYPLPVQVNFVSAPFFVNFLPLMPARCKNALQSLLLLFLIFFLAVSVVSSGPRQLAVLPPAVCLRYYILQRSMYWRKRSHTGSPSFLMHLYIFPAGLLSIAFLFPIALQFTHLFSATCGYTAYTSYFQNSLRPCQVPEIAIKSGINLPGIQPASSFSLSSSA